jgi:hypothetical protein
MKHYRPFLAAVALFLMMAGATFAQDSGRGAAATWQVQKYDVDVTLPPGERDRTITVKASLNLKNVSGKAASTLTLRVSPAAEVSSVRINDSTADFSKGEEKINTASNFQRIVMRLPSVAPDALLSAVVDYKITLKENSALEAVSPVGSQFLPLSFWYPTPNSWYFTRGSDKAPMRIRVQAPAGLTAVSAGNESAGAFEEAIRECLSSSPAVGRCQTKTEFRFTCQKDPEMTRPKERGPGRISDRRKGFYGKCPGQGSGRAAEDRVEPPRCRVRKRRDDDSQRCSLSAVKDRFASRR